MELLKKGSKGDAVGWLQQRLIDLGYNNCLVDEKAKTLTVDEDFGEITEGCLCSFQAKIIDSLTEDFIKQNVPIEYQYEFNIDGIMDFRIWYILENFDKLKQWYKVELEKPVIIVPEIITNVSIVDKVIELAKKEINVIEVGGNNYGDRIEEYQLIGSDGEVSGGVAWCQYFQNFLQIEACKELGINFKGTCSGYTPSVVNWGVSNDIGIKNCKIDDIEIGDMGFVYSAARKNAQHVFLIIGKSSNSVTTIEGNTNPGGGSDGFGVFQRTRPVGNQCWAVVKWWKLY